MASGGDCFAELNVTASRVGLVVLGLSRVISLVVEVIRHVPSVYTMESMHRSVAVSDWLAISWVARCSADSLATARR
jgi:hypothetical protein